jgi:hypothetical protein
MNVGGKHGNLSEQHRVNQEIMFLKEDIDESYEMEIEAMENPMLIIDEGDDGNPLVVIEYIQDISNFHCESRGPYLCASKEHIY